MATVTTSHTAGTPSTSDVEFDTVVGATYAGNIASWVNPSNARTSFITYASCAYSAGGGTGHSNVLRCTGDFYTSAPIGAGATITNIKAYAYTSGNTGLELHVNMISGTTSQASYTYTGTSQGFRNLFPNNGTLADWGVSHAQAVALLDGTARFNVWTVLTDDTSSVTARVYNVYLWLYWTTASTLPIAEGALPIGMFNY